MLTIKAVNKVIAARGIKAEIVQGKDYLWFYGDDVELAHSTSVMVVRLNQLTIEQWMSELDSIVADHKKAKEEMGERLYTSIKPK